MTSAPYWGQLPPPNVARGNSLRHERGSNDLTINTDFDQRGDRRSTQSQAQSQSHRPNRASTQTNAPTLSTQSPFVSPIDSEFRGDGLAPRPPSFPYGAPDTVAYNRDFAEKRQRRESRNREHYYDEPVSAPLPAAPDAPRAPPPVSYKQPYSNQPPSNSHAPARSRSTRNPDSAIKATPEEYYRPPGREEYTPGAEEILRRPSNGKAVTRVRGGQPQRTDSTRSQPRKGSLSEAEAQRQREWAPDRSPLQKLELTLDSITKEEKRARIEEAELLEREAKAGRGGERVNQNSVRFRNRPLAKAPESGSVEPQSLPEAGLVRSLSNRQKDQLQRSGTVERRRPTEPDLPPTTVGFDYQAKAGPVSASRGLHEASIPQRRESARDNTHLPVAAGAAGVSRSTSSKLRKNPPGDPWHSRRIDAERQFQDEQPRTSVERQRGSGGSALSKGTAFQSHPQALQDKELPKLPAEARRDTSHPLDRLDPDFEDDMDTKPARRLSKIERLTGQKPPPQASRSVQAGDEGRPGVVTANGVRFGAPQSAENIDTHHAPRPHGHGDRRGLSDFLPHRHHNVPGQGVYMASARLDEWKKGGVALLSGALLDLDVNEPSEAEKDKAWWEAGNTGKRRRSTTKTRKAEAYDGEYDDNNAPTRFKPPLFLKSGPLLRYCGLRKERLQNRATRNVGMPEREIWRGSIMIVTQDAESSYELAPTLRLFLQPTDLLPPPPAQVDGENEELAPEYVDPLAGLHKIGRDGRTLYIRPVDHLEEGKDLSREETDEGLFEMSRSPLDGVSDKKPACKKPHYDGEKAGKYKEVRGFRLHAEKDVTFWRFNIEIELREMQQRIAYRINRGPATGFWVPARGAAMNIMFHSCNGFSHDVDPNQFSGPDPMWRDVLNTHQTQPFHVMLGGGDQIYNDRIMEETVIFKDWTELRDPHHKERVPFTPDLQAELEEFYLNRYCMWFSQGLFGLATSQIPMVNIFDDHDIIDGFGSYPHDYMRSPVMSGLGAVAFKYYMLFQHQSSIDEGEETEPSWILGASPGPYIPELSRSVLTNLGRSVAFLGLDCRTERMYDEVVSAETYHKVFDRLEREIIKGETKHLIVMVGVPVAYPRMVWLENILTSRAMVPVKALGRAGFLGKKLLNNFDGGVEILDDLDDHWTAKHHKEERNWFIQELQDLAAEKSVRVTILGGDVHLGAIGQFFSNPKLAVPKDRDHRYMPNIISSAIVNTPPPDTLADVLNRRNKVHHLDEETDEDMIPIFTYDVNGKPRNNKRLLNRRNWCSIKMYDPELSPPPTPQTDGSPSPPPKRGNVLRRLSNTRGPSYRADAAPPLSNQGFFSRRPSMSRRTSTDSERPGMLKRTLSLTRQDFMPGLFRRSSKRRPDDGGINGYGAESDDNLSYTESPPPQRRTGIRGGSGGRDDQEGYFAGIAPPTTGRVAEHPVENASTSIAGSKPQLGLQRSAFHRTPTGLSQKQIKRGGNVEINLEGGLDICLNMEVNPKDPAGITMPYRLLVPALWYEEEQEGEAKQRAQGNLNRWVSLAKGKRRKKQWEEAKPR